MNALMRFLKTSAQKAPAEGLFGLTMAGKNVPPFAKLFEQAVDLGDARLYACSMAFAAYSGLFIGGAGFNLPADVTIGATYDLTPTLPVSGIEVTPQGPNTFCTIALNMHQTDVAVADT